MLIRPRLRVRDLRDALELLEVLVRRSVREIEAGQAPLFSRSRKVRYKKEAGAAEDWQSAAETHARGAGDCEDLAIYYAASRRVAGDAGARVVMKEVRPQHFHALVETGDGRTLDPSRDRGMGRKKP